MSSASAAECTHCRAKSSNPGATSEKQLFQFSWLTRFCMTSSRSLSSRRRQGTILSRPSKFFLFIGCLAVADARAGDVDLGKPSVHSLLQKRLTLNSLTRKDFANSMVLGKSLSVCKRTHQRISSNALLSPFRERPKN